MKSAPCLACLRISAIPSSAVVARIPMDDSGTPIHVGYQSESPCRLVIWRPAVVMRGPLNIPASMASRTASDTTLVVAGSAIDVNPAFRIFCAQCRPRSARYSTGAKMSMSSSDLAFP